MQNSLTIIKKNQLTSIQDLGRPHALALGFSTGGAADERALLAGNQALKNAPNAAAIEVCFGQFTLKANCACTLIITGADCKATVNDKPIKHWQIVNLKSDDILQLNSPKNGVYSYVCIAGGLQNQAFLASRSSINIKGLTIQNKDDILPLANHCYREVAKLTDEQRQQASAYLQQQNILTLRFIPHPLWQNLTLTQQNAICQNVYSISPQSNRMGYRLLGNKINLHNAASQLSKPVGYGTIQVPSSGEPIILMKDHQTIGGYATLGNVIKPDLFTLAQQPIQQKIQFLPISLEQAQQQLISFQQKFINCQ